MQNGSQPARPSRRRLFRAAGGASLAAAAIAAEQLAGPVPARAADGDPVILGADNTATQDTAIASTGGAGALLLARSASASPATSALLEVQGAAGVLALGPAVASMEFFYAPAGSGADDGANLNALFALGIKSIRLLPGTYFSSVMVTQPEFTSVTCPFKVATWTYQGASGTTAWYFHRTTAENASLARGELSGITFDGNSTSNTGITLLDCGDFSDTRVDVQVQNLPGTGALPAANVGVNVHNANFWTEVCKIRVYSRGVQVPLLLSKSGSGTISFARSDFDVYISQQVATNQGVVVDNVNPYDASWSIRGNWIASAAALTGSASYTATDATPAVFTAAGSNFTAGQPVKLSGGSPPGGFTNLTTYYVVSPTANTFELAAAPGGTALASTSTGNGTVLSGANAYSGGARPAVLTILGASGSMAGIDPFNIIAECDTVTGITDTPATIVLDSNTNYITGSGVWDFSFGPVQFSPAEGGVSGGSINTLRPNAIQFRGQISGDVVLCPYSQRLRPYDVQIGQKFETMGSIGPGGFVSLQSGKMFAATLTQNMAINLNGFGGPVPAAPWEAVIALQQPKTGGPFTVTWPSSVTWTNGRSAPPTPAAGNWLVVRFYSVVQNPLTNPTQVILGSYD